MAPQPYPPLSTDSTEELVEYVYHNPAEWLLYLRNINNYATALEGENAALRTTATELETTIAKRDGVI